MSASGGPRGNRQPNIVFFFTDDQRFDTIRALGNHEVVTPTMDSFVRGGTSLLNACIMGGSCAAVCMPSRAMLMTGRTLFHLDGQGQRVPEEHVLLGEVLQEAGYVTFGTGKWHNGSASYARGFSAGDEIFFGGMDDHWNVPACRFDPTGRYDVHRPVVRDPFQSNRVTHRQCDHIRPGKHSSELFCDAAIEYLRTRPTDAPFFMYVSFMAPHDPRTMPQEYLDLYDPDKISLPENFMPEHPFDNGELRVRDELLVPWPRRPEEIRRHIAEYYAMITHADAQMGRVMDALDAAGEAENTVIVLAGDNGLALGQHGLMGKQSLYEHSVRVPLVFAGPGIPAGEQRDAFCYLHDIYPTLCELVGAPVPETVEGLSLVPAMSSPAESVRDTLLFAYKDVQRGVRDRRYKLIEYAVEGKRMTQLFDLANDPWELRNLADDAARSSDVGRLRRELLRWRGELGDTQPELGERFWVTTEWSQ